MKILFDIIFVMSANSARVYGLSATRQIFAAICAATGREEAYKLIATNLLAATNGNVWLAQQAGKDISRRVLFLLCPNKLRFEKSGWVH